MTLIVVLGLIGLFFFMRRSREKPYSFKWIVSLSKHERFRNPWLMGVLLFGLNLFLFSATALILYGMTFMMIPFIHLVVMASATASSVLAWQSIVYSRDWGKGERLKVGMVGSSFYLFLFLFILYKWVTYVPRYPGEDEFMSAIGYFMAELVTGMAFVICFVMIVFLPVDKRV